MNKFLIAILSSIVLWGCGGSGDNSDTPIDETPITEVLKVDGLFINSSKTASLLVDIENGNVDVFVSGTGEALYDINTVSYTNGNVVNLTGVITITANTFNKDPDAKATLTYSADAEIAIFEYTYNYSIDNVNYQGTITETFNKQPDSLPVSQFSGSNMSAIAPSTEWIINDDSSISVNAVCTFSGSLNPVKFYYMLNLTATGCAPSHAVLENVTLNGIAYTADYQEGSRLILIAANDNINTVTWDVLKLEN